MNFEVKVDGKQCECKLATEDVYFTSESTSVQIKIEDIIGCEVVPPYFFFRQYALYLWYIKEEGRKLTKASIHISGEENVCEKLRKDITDRLQCLSKRPKSLLVLINPIGGSKSALKDYKNTVEPVLQLANIKYNTIVSERSKHMVDIVTDYDLSGTDGIVILGGDGSYTEVVSVLLRRQQKEAGIDLNDPAAKIQGITVPIGLIPAGSGNVLSRIVSGHRDTLNSTLHIVKGNVFLSNIIGAYADNKLLNYVGIASSYGAFSDFVYITDSYRWLGPFRYYVVPIWYGFVKPFIRPFNAEITFYTDVTETENSREQNEGEKEVLIEGKKLTGVKTYSKDYVVIERKLSDIGPFNGNLYDHTQKRFVWNKPFELPGHVFTFILRTEVMTELKLLKHLKELLELRDYSDESFTENVNCRGVKIRVNPDWELDGSEVDFLKHRLHIDGEIHEIKDLEMQFWLHDKVVPLFSSYL